MSSAFGHVSEARHIRVRRLLATTHIGEAVMQGLNEISCMTFVHTLEPPRCSAGIQACSCRSQFASAAVLFCEGLFQLPHFGVYLYVIQA